MQQVVWFWLSCHLNEVAPVIRHNTRVQKILIALCTKDSIEHFKGLLYQFKRIIFL